MMDQAESPEKKICSQCGELIACQATLCKYCGQFKNAWKRNIDWVSKLSLLPIAITVILFLGKYIYEQIRPNHPVDFLFLKSEEEMSIVNYDDKPIFLKEVTFIPIDTGYIFTIPYSEIVNTRINSGEEYKHKMVFSGGEEYTTYPPQRYEKGTKEWHHMMATIRDGRKCFQIQHRDLANFDLQDRSINNDEKPPLEKKLTVQYKAFIRYFSLSYKENMLKEVDVVSLVAVKNTDKCWEYAKKLQVDSKD